MELQQFCFPLIIRWRPQPKQQFSVTSLSKLKVKYSQAFPGSNITLSSSSMQPPVASRAGFVRRDFLICSQGWPQSLTSHIPINMGLIIAVPLLPVNYSFTYSNHLSSIRTIKDKLAPTAPYPSPLGEGSKRVKCTKGFLRALSILAVPFWSSVAVEAHS